MRPRRFPAANRVYSLPGGTEDNDLWAEEDVQRGWVRSVWVPTDEERQQIADGANLSLAVWAIPTPPVSLSVTPEQPGKPEDEEGVIE